MQKDTNMKARLKALNTDHQIKIRMKAMKDGRLSLYLDQWLGDPVSGDSSAAWKGKRSIEFLNLRLNGDKINDKEVLRKAELIRQQRETELQSFGSVITPITQKADFIAYWEMLSRKHHITWSSALNHFKKFHAEALPFNRLNSRICEEFKEYLQGIMKSNSAYLYISLLKAALNQAEKDGYLTTNPAKYVKVKKQDTERPYLTEEEIAKLKISCCPHQELKRAFLFACYTGLRLSDVEQLSWDNISDDALIIRQKKTEALLRIPLIPQAREYLEDRETGLVFDLPSRKHIYKCLKIWLKEAGVEKTMGFHSARHTFAITAIEAGIPINVIQKLLGHTNLSATLVYAKVHDKVVDQAGEQLARFLNKEEK